MIVAAGHFWSWDVWAIPLAFVIVCTLLLKAIERLWPRRWRVPQATERSGTVAMFAFGGVFLLIGVLAFFFTAVRPTYRAYHAKQWPTTSGVVVSSQLKSGRGSGRGPTIYQPDIRYHYAVHGQGYECSAYDVGGGFDTSRDNPRAFSLVDAHPPGRAVTVYYDPDDPADAVLSTDGPGRVWVSFIFLFAFGGVGGFLVVVTVRGLRRPLTDRE